MAGRFSIEAVVKVIDRVTRPITRMGSRFKKNMRLMGESVDRVSRKVRKLGKTIGSALGVAGAAGVFFVLASSIRAVIMTGAEFEQTMVGAAARFGDGIDKNSERFREMSDLAQQLGKTTEFTATEAAGGLNFLAKAGFDAGLSMRLLPGIVDLATASELDLARASDIATDALGAFGKNTGSASEVAANFSTLSDEMAKTTRISNVNMEQLFETIKKGAPAATAAGVSMETFLGFTAQLAGAGLKASDAGTALKNIFLKLADGKVQSQLKSMGVSVKELSGPNIGKIRDFADIMDDLNGAFDKKGTGELDRVSLLNDLFGLRGITGVANVLQNGTQGFRDYRDAIADSDGETKRLAKTLRDTRQGRIKEMTSAFEGLTLTVSAFADVGITAAIVGLTDLARASDSFIQNNAGLLKSGVIIAGVAVGLLALQGAVAGVVFIFGLLPALVGILTGTLAGLGALITTVALGIAAVLSQFKFVQDFFAEGGSGAEFASFARSVGNFIVGDDEAEAHEQRSRPGPVGPEERVADGVTERRTTTDSTLHVAGAPEGSTLDTPKGGGGTKIVMDPSGAFAG